MESEEASESKHPQKRVEVPFEGAEEDPRSLARSLLQGGRSVDHIIEQTGLQSEVIYGIKGALKKQGLLEEAEEEGEEGEEGEEAEVVTPPEVETIEEARDFIRERLDMVYGVGKAINVVMRALYDDPSSMRDPTLLHAFIKSLAPKANDQQLSVMVIKPLYAQLPTLPTSVSQYLSSMQPPPQPPFYWGMPTGWQPYRHLYPTQSVSSPYGYSTDPYGNQQHPGYPYPSPPVYPNPQTWYEASSRKPSRTSTARMTRSRRPGDMGSEPRTSPSTSVSEAESTQSAPAAPILALRASARSPSGTFSRSTTISSRSSRTKRAHSVRKTSRRWARRERTARTRRWMSAGSWNATPSMCSRPDFCVSCT